MLTRNSLKRSIVLTTASLLVSHLGLAKDAVLNFESFPNLHSLIKPKSNEERWIQIPWVTRLWDARVRAAAEGKPILLWEMDGHPLGCT